MPLDHFIPQVHLKNFYAPDLEERMYAVRKSGRAEYQCDAKSQCRIRDGSTNAYLTEDRVVEEFLRSIEPKYNNALNAVRAHQITGDVVFVLAGYMSYITSCSPAAMRLNQRWLQASAEATATMLDEMREFPPAPDSLGAKSMSELLAEGTVEMQVDPKYPQAIGINTLMRKLDQIGNFDWQFLHNKHAGRPFLTSDYPCAIEQSPDPRIVLRTYPLAPDLAVRVYPNFRYQRPPEGVDLQFDFPLFRRSHTDVSPSQAASINRLIVRAAETTVYAPRMDETLRTFIAKNSAFRTETVISQLPADGGVLTIAQQRIRPIASLAA